MLCPARPNRLPPPVASTHQAAAGLFDLTATFKKCPLSPRRCACRPQPYDRYQSGSYDGHHTGGQCMHYQHPTLQDPGCWAPCDLCWSLAALLSAWPSCSMYMANHLCHIRPPWPPCSISPCPWRCSRCMTPMATCLHSTRPHLQSGHTLPAWLLCSGRPQPRRPPCLQSLVPPPHLLHVVCSSLHSN